MELTQEREIPHPTEKVWSALLDPVVLQACIPGCELVSRPSPTQFILQVVTRIGPMKINFNGRMLLQNFNPPDSYSLIAPGEEGLTSLARGEAHLKFYPITLKGRDATRLNYRIQLKTGGKLVKITGKLIDTAAAAMADVFFERLNHSLGSSR